MKYLTRVKISQVRKGMSVIKLFLSEQSDKKKEWKNVCVEFNCKNVQLHIGQQKKKESKCLCTLKAVTIMRGCNV